MEYQKISEAKPIGPDRKGLVVIYLTLFLDMMGSSLLMPIVPFIVRQYSADALSVGLLSTIYAGAAFLAAPMLGWLSDRYGRRPVLLVSLLGATVGYGIFGVGGALWVLFLSRLVAGLTAGNITAAMAYIADTTQPQERTRYYAFGGVAFGLGFIFGPLMAGALSGVSLTAPAFAAGLLSFSCAIYGFFLLPESLPASKRVTGMVTLTQINPLSVIYGISKIPNLGYLLGAIFIVFLAFSGMFSYVSVFMLDRFNAAPTETAALFAVVGVAQMVGQGVLVYRLTPIFGEKKIAICGLIVQAAAYLAFAVAPSMGWIFPLAILSALGNAFTRPTLDAMVANNTAQHEQGRAMGAAAGLTSLTGAIGPLLAGVVYGSIAPVSPFVIGGLLLFTASLLILKVRPPGLRADGLSAD